MRRSRVMIACLATAAVLAAGGVTVNAYADDGAGAPAGQSAEAVGQVQIKAVQPTSSCGVLIGPSGECEDQRIHFEFNLSGQGLNEPLVAALAATAQNEGLEKFVNDTIADNPAHLDAPVQSESIGGQTVKVSTNATGVVFDVPFSEVRADAVWWQSLIANILAGAMTLVFAGTCLAAGPEVFPVCTGLTAAVTELVKGIVLQAFSGQLRDVNEWGNTLVNSIFAGIIAGGISGIASGWIKDNLAPTIGNFAGTIRAFADSLSSWWNAAKAVLGGTATYLESLRPALQNALNGRL